MRDIIKRLLYVIFVFLLGTLPSDYQKHDLPLFSTCCVCMTC